MTVNKYSNVVGVALQEKWSGQSLTDLTSDYRPTFGLVGNRVYQVRKIAFPRRGALESGTTVGIGELHYLSETNIDQ